MPRRPPASDGLQKTVARFDDASRRLDVLEKPDGSQLFQALAKVQELISNIGSYVDAYLVAGFTSGSATITGVLTAATGYITGRLTADGGLTSADVKSRTLSVGYDSVYIDVNNVMGKAPSARRFKQDEQDHDFPADVVDRMQGKTFRIVAAVEQLGDDAPVEIGYIADDLEAIGLDTFVRYDEDGQISGLAYERIVIVAIDSLKDARREIRDLRGEIAAIKAHLGL